MNPYFPLFDKVFDIIERYPAVNPFASDAVKIVGVLLCPIRLQFLEKLDAWIAQQDRAVVYELQAAEWVLAG